MIPFHIWYTTLFVTESQEKCHIVMLCDDHMWILHKKQGPNPLGSADFLLYFPIYTNNLCPLYTITVLCGEGIHFLWQIYLTDHPSLLIRRNWSRLTPPALFSFVSAFHEALLISRYYSISKEYLFLICSKKSPNSRAKLKANRLGYRWRQKVDAGQVGRIV